MRSSRETCLTVSEPEDARRRTGNLGEEAAERHLKNAGMRIVAKGFRFRGGEIDLIAQDGSETVFIEVKTRTSEGFGYPAEAVTPSKRRKILRAALFFLQARGAWQQPCRFDVISVWLEGDVPTRLEHLRDAFRSDD